ncbi:MAG: hypothetical protein ACOZQL_02995, partial [Myxococcota bacterium]
MNRLLLPAVAVLVLSGCGPTTPKCDSSTCATGCCDAKGLCQGGATPTACGSFGAACQACQLGFQCQLGVCVPGGGMGGGSSTGGGGGSTGGGGGSIGGGGGGSIGGGGGSIGGGGGSIGGGGGS